MTASHPTSTARWPRRAPRPRLALAALAGAVAYGTLAAAAGAAPSALDRSAFELSGRLESGAVVRLAKLVTALGDLRLAGAVLLLAALWLLARRRPALGLALVAAGVASTLLFHALKADFGRPRPVHPLVATSGSSFPSGHAVHAVAWLAVALVLAPVAGRARRPLIALGALITVAVGLTRVLLRAHYLTDVLAGWSLGIAVFAACGLAALSVGAFRHNVRSP